MPADYQPYGVEWKAEMMKWRKRDIIDLLRQACTKEGANLHAHNSESVKLPSETLLRHTYRGKGYKFEFCNDRLWFWGYYHPNDQSKPSFFNLKWSSLIKLIPQTLKAELAQQTNNSTMQKIYNVVNDCGYSAEQKCDIIRSFFVQHTSQR